ncbi:MAG: aminoglycoside phosphotransferase family protein [Candidatus Abyssobacteria bacterium SURF_5]|uniref:Aminoglycoside phosphotransferase family protein n=1 Tax=Abyssobacteria bacterium (strain SURF_5) TaxID=2093360 RepID=A0A3A4NIU3_ABYX5|nr:MAG: aminoglycoside phosphotransferase family protein [Candidatus Abyssubacteria bacterium SURF_5]
MSDTFLNKISMLDLSPADNERLGLPLGGLRLQRAWPRSHNHLLLEYAAGERTIVGQWLSNTKQLQSVFQKTAECCQKNAKVLELPDRGILLQAEGADRRLPALASLVARPGALLVSHRPEQRAVVRLELADGLFYAKVVIPDRAQGLAYRVRAVQKLVDNFFSIPKLAKADLNSGILVFSALPGQSLYDLLNSQSLADGAQAAGKALRKLHSVSDSVRAPRHGISEEIETIKFWLKQIKVFAPHLYFRLFAASTDVFRALGADQTPLVLLHRDFYDKQIFLDEQGLIGLLDLDTVAIGEAALDVANALVHFELRHLQSRLSQTESMAAATAFLDGYQPDQEVQLRIPAYMDAARLRLACVYAFRPYQSHLAEALVSRIRQPISHINSERIQRLGIQLFLEKSIRLRSSSR